MGWCKLKCIIMRHSLSYVSQINCQGGLRVLMNVYEVAQSECQINNSAHHCVTGVYSVETSRYKQLWEWLITVLTLVADCSDPRSTGSGLIKRSWSPILKSKPLSICGAGPKLSILSTVLYPSSLGTCTSFICFYCCTSQRQVFLKVISLCFWNCSQFHTAAVSTALIAGLFLAR